MTVEIRWHSSLNTVAKITEGDGETFRVIRTQSHWQCGGCPEERNCRHVAEVEAAIAGT